MGYAILDPDDDMWLKIRSHQEEVTQEIGMTVTSAVELDEKVQSGCMYQPFQF